MVSSTLGSSTSTGWKRRSRAASFSTRLRYSSRVVAPIMCSSPRASIGLSMLPASMAPSAAPAPTTVCSSSMNRRIRPSAALTSLSTALRRSSNSPRYLAPADQGAHVEGEDGLVAQPLGTSPRTIRPARPSTMAVLPTPGSPISTGLFLDLRDRIWTTRRISASRPITGSSLPARASATRSRPYFSKRLVGDLGHGRGDPLVAADPGQLVRNCVAGDALLASAAARPAVRSSPRPGGRAAGARPRRTRP